MFRVANDIIIDSVDVSADERSEILDISNVYGMSIQAVTTGTISAVAKIEVSNDKENWVELSSPTITISNVTNDAVQAPEMFYKWARIFIDVTSGTTNTVKVYFTSKGI